MFTLKFHLAGQCCNWFKSGNSVIRVKQVETINFVAYFHSQRVIIDLWRVSRLKCGCRPLNAGDLVGLCCNSFQEIDCRRSLCLSNFSLSFCHYQLINCSLCVHCSITSIMCAWLLMRTHRFLILLTTTLMCFRCRLDSSFSVCSSVSSHYCCCCKVTSSQVCVCCKPECQQERPESCGYCGN